MSGETPETRQIRVLLDALRRANVCPYGSSSTGWASLTAQEAASSEKSHLRQAGEKRVGRPSSSAVAAPSFREERRNFGRSGGQHRAGERTRTETGGVGVGATAESRANIPSLFVLLSHARLERLPWAKRGRGDGGLKEGGATACLRSGD